MGDYLKSAMSKYLLTPLRCSKTSVSILTLRRGSWPANRPDDATRTRLQQRSLSCTTKPAKTRKLGLQQQITAAPVACATSATIDLEINYGGGASGVMHAVLH